MKNYIEPHNLRGNIVSYDNANVQKSNFKNKTLPEFK